MNKKKLVTSSIIIGELLFILSAWYIYILNNYVLNLIFALVITIGIFGTNLWSLMFRKSDSNENEITYKKMLEHPIWLIFLYSLPILLFFVFMGFSLTYGGSQVSIEYAEEYIEAYEVGKY